MDPIVQLKDKVVLVTGAGQGMGASHVRFLAGHGAVVIGTDLDAGLVEEIAAEVRESGGRATALALDVTDHEAWRAVFGHVRETFGQLDGLVNNAGVYRTMAFLETDAELLDLHLQVNVAGPMRGMQLASEVMASGGSIVNVASVAGLRGAPGAAAYAASKWALRGLSRSAAVELGPLGIRVNCVLPGAIDTQMISEASRSGGGAVADIAIPRPGRTEEASAMVAFLLSEASSYSTGQDFVIDGGMSA